MKLVDIIVSWSRKKRNRRCKILSLMLGALIYGVVIPITIVYAPISLDKMFNLELGVKPYSTFIAVPLIASGLSFIFWAVWTQWNIGKGSPLPLAPTQKLVIKGPYAYCRNPMTFGAILYYLGLIIYVNSLTGLILVLIVSTIYALYIKLVEEKELELRFGKDYIEYKKRTPFLIPRPRKSEVKT